MPFQFDSEREGYNSPEYKAWRYGVFTRDGWKCVMCPSKEGIEAHHIKRWVDFPKLRYVNSNGVTLCKNCHEMVTNKEHLYEEQFTRHIAQAKIAKGETRGLNKKTATTKAKFKAMYKWRPRNPRVRY